MSCTPRVVLNKTTSVCALMFVLLILGDYKPPVYSFIVKRRSLYKFILNTILDGNGICSDE